MLPFSLWFSVLAEKQSYVSKCIESLLYTLVLFCLNRLFSALCDDYVTNRCS